MYKIPVDSLVLHCVHFRVVPSLLLLLMKKKLEDFSTWKIYSVFWKMRKRKDWRGGKAKITSTNKVFVLIITCCSSLLLPELHIFIKFFFFLHFLHFPSRCTRFTIFYFKRGVKTWGNEANISTFRQK